ncbi:MAG: DsbA family protein [Deltaproteobacteria bacterium]
MNSRQDFVKRVGAGTILLAAGAVLLAAFQASKVSIASAGTVPPSDRIIRYIRQKFGVPSSQNLSLGPLEAAVYPGYYRALVTVQDGADKKTSTVAVSEDGHYLILSDFLPVGTDFRAGVVKQLTDIYKIPSNVKLSVGPASLSPYPGFLQTTITANNNGKENKQTYYITSDKRFLIVGGIFNMRIDPVEQARKVIKLSDQPSEGPANAPVTVVEYADLECPMCAQEHKFIMTELLPHFGNKVRVVFKEFPLVQIHTWSYTAAIANECAYQIDPSKFAAYRSIIFDHQTSITAVTARDLLLYYGQEVGLDRLKLAACLDSKASLPRVEAGMREGKELGVDRTPTFYINGQILIGGGPRDFFFQAVDEALRAAR